MEQLQERLGPQILSVFDAHICESIPSADRPDMNEIRSLIENHMEFESSELWEIKVSPKLFSSLKHRTLSDSDIITCPYNPIVGDEMQDVANMLVVASFVSAVASLQDSLISEYTLIGGGMTFGDVLIRGSSVYGDAVNRALALKSDKSLTYPRMAVSEEVKRMFDDLCARHNVLTRGKLGNAIEMDSDGTLFINYLSAQSILERIRSGKDEPIDPLAIMIKHKRKIDSMLECGGDSIRSNGLLRERYGWLISYHNHVVTSSGVGKIIDPSILD